MGLNFFPFPQASLSRAACCPMYQTTIESCVLSCSFFFFKARYVKPILAIPSWVKRVENWHLLTIAISLIQLGFWYRTDYYKYYKPWLCINDKNKKKTERRVEFVWRLLLYFVARVKHQINNISNSRGYKGNCQKKSIPLNKIGRYRWRRGGVVISSLLIVES